MPNLLAKAIFLLSFLDSELNFKHQISFLKKFFSPNKNNFFPLKRKYFEAKFYFKVVEDNINSLKNYELLK